MVDPQGRGGSSAGIIAAPILTGSPATKLVLLLMAVRACNYCGLTWISNRTLIAETELSERSVRDCLARLRAIGLLKIHAYGEGGRGRATEYIVMPNHRELSTAPCGKCQFQRLNPAGRAGYDKSGTAKPGTESRVSTKPGSTRPIKGATLTSLTNDATLFDATESKEKPRRNVSATIQEPITIQEPEPGSETAAPLISEPPPTHPPDPAKISSAEPDTRQEPPRNAPEARTQAIGLLENLTQHFSQGPSQGKDGALEAISEREAARPVPPKPTTSEALKKLGYVD